MQRIVALFGCLGTNSGRAVKMSRWVKAAAVMVVMALSSISEAAAPRNFALLVGATRYPHLPVDRQLAGPENDVRIFSDLLRRGRYSRFEPADVQVLTGWPDDPRLRPTRANIEREFRRLATEAAVGDQVVILMAGHGSQQPANPDPTDSEADALDEVFLPADVIGWDGRAARIRNAITDDEIREWLAAIRAKGAFVWILFDCCHAGTMTRGGTERVREVPVRELVPVVRLARGTVSPRSRTVVASSASADGMGGIIAMYAAQSFEATPEKRLPEGSETWHGLFTYYVTEILEQTSEPLTYEELIERLIERYRSVGRFGPTPAVEGTATRRIVLGSTDLSDPSPLLLGEKARNGQLRLRAGTILGVTRGSVLAVYDHTKSNGGSAPIGHVRVTTAEATRSWVVPVAYRDLPEPDVEKLVPGSRCQQVTVGFMFTPLTIGIASGASARVTRALRLLETNSSGMARPSGAKVLPEWLLNEGARGVWLEPAGSARDAPSDLGAHPLAGALMVADRVADDLPAKLANVARRIARAVNLRRLATPAAVTTGGMSLDAWITVLRDRDDRVGTRLELDTNGRTLRVGQAVEFHVRNRGTKPVDLTAFFIGSDFEIRTIFPVVERQVDTRLEAGAEIVLARAMVNADTLGDEDLVIIGVPPSMPPVDFASLTQPGIARLDRSMHAGDSVNGLQALLADAMRGSRGVSQIATDDRFVVKLLPWRTVR